MLIGKELLGCLVLTVVVSAAQAAGGGTKARAAAEKSAPAKTPTAVELRAAMFRTMADLVEAQSAQQPNPEAITRLRQKLQTQRREYLAQASPSAVSGRASGGCPWGMTPRGGAGMMAGRGGAARRGSMMCGPGAGGCQGRGMGRGRGPGFGQFPGRAGVFVDDNGDGVCDNFARLWGSPARQGQ